MAFEVAESLGATITLRDGVTMPMFGLGMFRTGYGEVEPVVKLALQHGYRLIDTAAFHGTEAEIGQGIRNSGISRQDVFVISKPWIDSHGAENVRKAFHDSLNRLEIGYVDLYMIHSPAGGSNVETYRTMLQLKEEGLVRSVGVSNFNVQHLEGLRKAGLPVPSVNQIELHPWMRRDETVQYCREHGIVIIAYSPLAKGQHMDDPILADISKRYGRTAAQVLIRWSVQSGFIPIPKSSRLERIAQNADVFCWRLEQHDMATLNSLPQISCMTRLGWNPMDSQWVG